MSREQDERAVARLPCGCYFDSWGVKWECEEHQPADAVATPVDEGAAVSSRKKELEATHATLTAERDEWKEAAEQAAKAGLELTRQLKATEAIADRAESSEDRERTLREERETR